MRVSVAPFLLPSAGTVQHSGWSIGGDPAIPMGRILDTWDYQTELRLQGGLVLERARLCSEAGLAETSQVEVLVIARSTATKIERCVFRSTIPQLDNFELILDMVLNGDWLGGRLTLETLVVATEPRPLGRTGASVIGAILWGARHDTTLEGQGGLFPTDSEDFNETRKRHKDVPWVLNVEQVDYDSLFTSSVRLTLNSGVRAVSEMLTTPTSAEARWLAKMLELDVTRQLVFIAIQSEEVMTREPMQDGESLGDVLRLLVSRIWPSASVASLLRWRSEQPQRLELDIQQFVRAFQ
jgi:hypothetical protein